MLPNLVANTMLVLAFKSEGIGKIVVIVSFNSLFKGSKLTNARP